MATSNTIKPHAIMVEFMFQGHINPFIHLALGLASRGITVTYVQTEFTNHQISTSHNEKPENVLFSGAYSSGLDIRYKTISDGFPLDFDRDANFVEFYESMLRDFPARVDELVGKIVESDEESMLLPFLVADAAYFWPAEVAEKYNIVNVSFWPSPALRLSVGYHLGVMRENGLLKSHGDYKDHTHDIPGVKSTNVRDFIKYAPPEDDPSIPSILRESIIKSHIEIRKADFILLNTVQELESDTISSLNQKLPTYAIGPTNFLTNFIKIPIINSLWVEIDCTGWLDTKPRGSVLFISFGSIAQIDKHVVSEIAYGLSKSGANFIWVLRPGAANDGETEILPPEFENDVRDRGLIIPWCNQCKVLSNQAIGGFLTHCGWSSILESIWFGVPMICYPISMDQPTNRNMVVDDWKIGINLCDGPLISKEEVEEKINILMGESGLGYEIRREMEKVSKIVQNALEKSGSSGGSLDRFINDLKDKILHKKQKDMLTTG